MTLCFKYYSATWHLSGNTWKVNRFKTKRLSSGWSKRGGPPTCLTNSVTFDLPSRLKFCAVLASGSFYSMLVQATPYILPLEIAATRQTPDVVTFSQSLRIVLLIELTVPREDIYLPPKRDKIAGRCGAPQASYDRRRHRICFQTGPAQAFPKK